MASTFKSVGSKDVGTSPVSTYTVPALTTTTVIGLSLANTLPSTLINVDVYVTKSAVDYYLIKNAPIAAGGTLVLIGGDQKLVMATTDVLKVKSTNATSVDVFVSMLELT